MSSVGKIKELGAQLQLQRFCQETAGSLPKALNVKLIDPVTGQPTAETSVDLWRAVMPVNNVAITGPDSVLPIWPPAARPPIMGQDPNGPNRRVLAAYDWDWTSAEKEYKRAIELNPRYGTAHQWYGGYLAVMGRSDEALAERKLAQELEPLSLTINFELGLAFYHARAYDQAIEQLQKTLELDQHFPAAPNLLPAAYEQHGMYSQAIAEFKKSIPLIAASESTLSKAGLGHVYGVTGRKSEARAVLNELKQTSEKEFLPATSIALVYAGLGEKDQAFVWLEKAYEQRAFQLQWIKLEPRWDSLHSDPRFQDLVRRIGLP